MPNTGISVDSLFVISRERSNSMSTPTNLTYGEMQGAPPELKSKIRSWYEGVQKGSNTMARAKQHAAAAGQGIRQGGEALLVAGILGAASVELPQGLDHQGIPIDAALGVTNLVAGVAFAHEEFGSDLRNAGSACLAVFAYRKTQDLLAAKKRARGGVPGFQAAKTSTVHGDYDYSSMGEDPIIAAAKLL